MCKTGEGAEKAGFEDLLIKVSRSFNCPYSKLFDCIIWEFKTLCFCPSYMFTVHLNFLWVK